MGNRAVIAFESMPELGVYVHWNGGPESVLAFLEAANRRGYRSPEFDPTYGVARFVGLLHEFFGTRESTSLGIGPVDSLDDSDNGIYWCKGWNLVRREVNTRGGGFPRHHVLALPQLNAAELEKFDAILAELTSPAPVEEEATA